MAPFRVRRKRTNLKSTILALFAIISLSVIVTRLGLDNFDLRKKADYSDVTLLQESYESSNPASWSFTQPSSSNVVRSSERATLGSFTAKFHDSSDFLETSISPTTGVVSTYFYDNMSTDKKVFIGAQNTNTNPLQTITLGVRTNSGITDNYHLRNGEGDDSFDLDTHIKRTLGWHLFELVITPEGSYAKIDDISLAYLGKQDQASGVNPNLTKFNYVFIANQKTDTNYFDDTSIIIPSFVQYTPQAKEIEEHFLDLFALTHSRPVYDSSKKEQSTRELSNYALAHAVLYTIDSSANTSSKNEALYAIQELINRQANWDGTLGFENTAYNLGLSAWLIHNQLSSTQQSTVKNIITGIATDLEGSLPLSEYNDYDVGSTAEENSWKSAFFGLAGWMYPSHSHASTWKYKRGQFTNHIFTEKPTTRYSVTTQTLHSNFDLENHRFKPHPQYVLASIGQIAQSSIPIMKTTSGAYTGDFVNSQISQTWNHHKQFYDTNTLLLKNIALANNFEGKDDWYTDLSWSNHALQLLDMLNLDNSTYNDVVKKEWYLTRDYLAFPNYVDLYVKKGNLIPQLSGSAGEKLRTSLNAEAAARHATTYLLLDNSITLSPL